MPLTEFEKLVRASLKSYYTASSLRRKPSWLTQSSWQTPSCWSAGDKIVAVDAIPSAEIPRYFYEQVVGQLLRDHPQLRVIVVCDLAGLEERPRAEGLCRKLGVGLKTYTPNIGLQTVVSIDLDSTEVPVTFADEPGWFPEAILAQVEQSHNLTYSNVLADIVPAIRDVAGNEQETKAVVHSGIDTLLKTYPQCHPDIAAFMRLDHFEKMLKINDPTLTEHVFHSFRVFLAGCPVISRHYTYFKDAHRCVSLGPAKSVSIEYCWLLTSLFHDIGQPYEKAPALVTGEIGDDDMEVVVRSKPSVWAKNEYVDARRNLASLIAFYGTDGPVPGQWDFGVVTNAHMDNLCQQLGEHYACFGSHGVVGAVKLLAAIVKQAQASEESVHRPFVITHAAPAALSILLHDWRLWGVAKEWKVFPIKGDILPLASLLIFIDTWDDFRRSGSGARIHVADYSLEDSMVSVTVNWADPIALKNEEVKFEAFENAIRDSEIDYRIVPQAVDAR